MKKLLAVALLLLAAGAHADSWTYRDSGDKMTGKTTRFADLLSSNSLNLGAPYSGTNFGNLKVRSTPGRSLDVIVNIEKGQIICAPFEGCAVRVRFGDKPPMTFRGLVPTDFDSTALFLEPAKKFAENAKKVSKILVELTIFQEGTQVLEFTSPEPLKWQ